MRRTRKRTSKGTYRHRSKRSSKGTYKRTSKRTSKRVSRKQSGGEWVDMKLMNNIIKKRSNTSTLADTSANKAKEFKELIEKEFS